MMKLLKTYNGTRGVTTALFIIYLIALSWILLLKLGVRFSYMEERRTNLVPFSESFIFTSENVLNLLIFIPLGIYAGILFEQWGFGKKLLFAFLVSLLVECLQYILRIGALDTIDIITNTLGGLTGLLILKGLEKVFNNNLKTQKFINIMATVGTIFTIAFLVALKMNLLPVRYQ